LPDTLAVNVVCSLEQTDRFPVIVTVNGVDEHWLQLLFKVAAPLLFTQS
jgi:hypothetical protein